VSTTISQPTPPASNVLPILFQIKQSEVFPATFVVRESGPFGEVPNVKHVRQECILMKLVKNAKTVGKVNTEQAAQDLRHAFCAILEATKTQ
jgi:hypothetical protein